MLTPMEMALLWVAFLFGFFWTNGRPLSMGWPEGDETTGHSHEASESYLHDP
jgi:hypothetical protein